MFMVLMTPARLQHLTEEMVDQWRAAVVKWETMDDVVLFDEVREIICRAVCTWAGVSLKPAEVKQRTRDIAAMIEGAGAIGLQHWQGRLARRRTAAVLVRKRQPLDLEKGNVANGAMT